MAADLTPRQASFVSHYLVLGNATQAAINAGYSEKTAYAQGSRLLKKAEVAEAVRAANAETAGKFEITRERIMAELAAIAFSDLRDVAEWKDDALSLIDSASLSEDAAHALREVVATTSTVGKSVQTRLHVKQHDKLKALQLLGQAIDMFSDKLNVNVTGGITLSALARMVEPGQGEIEG